MNSLQRVSPRSWKSRSIGDLRQVAFRINRGAVQAHFVMQMGAGAPSGAAGKTYQVTFAYHVTFFHIETI